MSKLTHKCPNCGATMPVDVKYCRKCHAKMDSGRVEVLSKPEKEQKPQKGNKKDALRNLPKPVRPVEEEQQPVGTVPAAESAPAPVQGQNGYFSPEQQEQAVAAAMTGAVVRRERRAPAGSDMPRPVSTARGAGAQPYPNRNKDKNLWQIITVLAIIFVIIVVAILLVIKLNQPASENVQSEPYGTPNVIIGDNDAPPVPGATATNPANAPEGLVVPTATPSVTPTPTPVPRPSATPIPAATATPVPSATPASNGNYSVTPANDTVYINGIGVNIRSGPGTEYDAIGSESTGKQLQRTGRTSNGWSQVAYNGQTAYVLDSLLTTTQPSTGGSANTTLPSGVTAASGTVKVTSAIGANLRSGPGTGYDVVTAVPVNTELTRTGTSGSWTLVSYNGQNLYVSTSLVTDSSAGTTTATTAPAATTAPVDNTGVTTASGTVTVTGNDVNIRTGPGTNYSRIGSVNSGTVLTVTGISGNWYQISYNGQTAYIIGDYVKRN